MVGVRNNLENIRMFVGGTGQLGDELPHLARQKRHTKRNPGGDALERSARIPVALLQDLPVCWQRGACPKYSACQCNKLFFGEGGED